MYYEYFMNSFLFNPENDLALAAGSRCYTPPRNAALLARCGALLPLWFAENDNDVVLAQNPDEEWLERVRQLFGLDSEVAPVAPPKSVGRPWGWSPAVVTEFVRRGVDRSMLPDDNAIEKMRSLSHRLTSVQINRRLAGEGIDTPPFAVEVFDRDGFQSAVKAFDGRFVVKSPWSSTGRGVFMSTSVACDVMMKNAVGIINRQGSVIVEPLLDRKTDFAMLFHAARGKVSYRGLSLFETSGTAYTGNLLLPEHELARRIGSQLRSPDILNTVADSLETVLTDIVGPVYEGWMGVDMMVYGDRQLAPCIELNLRMTMGVVAMTLRNRYVAPGSTGCFMVEHGVFGPCDNDRAVIRDRKLVSGSVDLVPPGRGFRIALNVGHD